MTASFFSKEQGQNATGWKSLLISLSDLWGNIAKEKKTWEAKREIVARDLLKGKRVGEANVLLFFSPFYHEVLFTEKEEAFVERIRKELPKREASQAYSQAFLALMLYVPLYTIANPSIEKIEPWLVSLIGQALQRRSMIARREEDADMAMAWLVGFVERAQELGEKGQLLGGKEAWRKTWIPSLGQNIQAWDFYSTTSNLAPFLRKISCVRQKAFSSLCVEQSQNAPVIVGRIGVKKKTRIAFLCSNILAHGDGIPYVLWLLACCNREKYEVFLLVREKGSLGGAALGSSFYDRLKIYATIIFFNEEDISFIQSLDIDLLYNFFAVCAGRRDWISYQRLAKVQVTGFYTPATTGCSSMDYYITSPDLDDPSMEAFTEKCVYSEGLPFCIHAESFLDTQPLGNREMFGFDKETIILTSGASMFGKLTEPFLDALMSTLLCVPNAIFVAMPRGGIALAAALLMKACRARGVDPARIRLYQASHRTLLYGMIQMSDVFLDFFPFTGTNNVIDPVALGVPPVVLCPREGGSRNHIAGAILRALSLHELIAETPENYVDIAVDLCRATAKRDNLKKRMGREVFEKSPLCDGPAFAKRMYGVFEDILVREGII